MGFSIKEWFIGCCIAVALAAVCWVWGNYHGYSTEKVKSTIEITQLKDSYAVASAAANEKVRRAQALADINLKAQEAAQRAREAMLTAKLESQQKLYTANLLRLSKQTQHVKDTNPEAATWLDTPLPEALRQ